MMRKNIAGPLLFTILLIIPVLVKAQAKPTYARGMFMAKGDTLPYRILFPLNFDPAKAYPVVFVLHGSGERGNDNEAQLIHGGDAFLDGPLGQQYPAIVIFPQCPKDGFWSDVEMPVDSAGHTKFIFP